MITYAELDSPVGELLLIAEENELLGLYFARMSHAPAPAREWRRDAGAAPIRSAAEQLAEYFAGDRRAFDVPFRFARATPFQFRVWQQLARIPFGETISYAQLARAIDAPQAVRAVGTAVGRNPISIIVPCHRVVGSNGSLTGFAGGIPAKRELLRLESAASPSVFAHS